MFRNKFMQFCATISEWWMNRPSTICPNFTSSTFVYYSVRNVMSIISVVRASSRTTRKPEVDSVSRTYIFEKLCKIRSISYRQFKSQLKVFILENNLNLSTKRDRVETPNVRVRREVEKSLLASAGESSLGQRQRFDEEVWLDATHLDAFRKQRYQVRLVVC